MVKMIIMFKRREGMTREAFMDYRRDVHAPLLLAIPEARHIRKFVVSYPISAPQYAEEGYDAIVEAWFDSLADMDALFFSDNFLQKVDPDHLNFIDMTSITRFVSTEIVVIE